MTENKGNDKKLDEDKLQTWRLGADIEVGTVKKTGPQEPPETAEFDEDGNQIFRTKKHYETAKKAEKDREFVRLLRKERKKVTIHSHKRDPINE